jgi:glycosyltransferase involved in cell wall biosynthesis
VKLSVILPCFNGAGTITVQLDALTHQQWPGGWELIVVNNGSTDSSMAIVERYRGRLPGLRIVEAHEPGTTRLGVPHSYNVGIGAATGDAFVFCEADDEVAPGWLAVMGQALGTHDFVVARLDHRKLNAEWLHPRNGEGYQGAGLARLDHEPHYLMASACGFGLSRALVEKVGALSTTFPIAHDAEYCWRAQQAGYTLHFEPDALIHYREKSALKDRFYQGQNWGLDTTRVHQHYQMPPGRLPLLRQLIAIGRSLPAGLRAALQWAFGPPPARQMLADWVWDMGWSTGKLKAIVRKRAVRR